MHQRLQPRAAQGRGACAVPQPRRLQGACAAPLSYLCLALILPPIPPNPPPQLVWCPPTFASFVLVDDAGGLLCSGTPRGALPALRERQANFDVVRGSKYEREAIRVGAGAAGAAGAAE